MKRGLLDANLEAPQPPAPYNLIKLRVANIEDLLGSGATVGAVLQAKFGHKRFDFCGRVQCSLQPNLL
jgi:hypothetical protein